MKVLWWFHEMFRYKLTWADVVSYQFRKQGHSHSRSLAEMLCLLNWKDLLEWGEACDDDNGEISTQEHPSLSLSLSHGIFTYKDQKRSPITLQTTLFSAELWGMFGIVEIIHHSRRKAFETEYICVYCTSMGKEYNPKGCTIRGTIIVISDLRIQQDWGFNCSDVLLKVSRMLPVSTHNALPDDKDLTKNGESSLNLEYGVQWCLRWGKGEIITRSLGKESTTYPVDKPPSFFLYLFIYFTPLSRSALKFYT